VVVLFDPAMRNSGQKNPGVSVFAQITTTNVLTST